MRLSARKAMPQSWAVSVALILATAASVYCAAQSSSEVYRIGFVVASCLATGMMGVAWLRGELSMREVLGVAIVLRLIAFPLLPGLSDDGFRYLWDGLLQLHGQNPYLSRPEALGTAFDGVLFPLLNSASYYSVYPPASQLVFALGGFAAEGGWPVGWYVIKAVFVCFEFGGIWALSRMVAARHVVLYAWNPLAVLEVAGQAHTEAGLVGGLLVSYWAYRRDRRVLSVTGLTVAGWFKLYPFVMLPFLLRRIGWRYGVVVLGVSLVLVAPYANPEAPMRVAESLDLYVRSFEFNAGPYFVLKSIWGAFTGEDGSKLIGPLLRGVFLLGVGFLFLASHRSRLPLVWVWVGVLSLLWATATTVHPWYLLGVLALLPLTLGSVHRSLQRAILLHAFAWIWLGAASLGTYLLYSVGEAAYWSFVWIGWAGWAGLLVAAIASWGLPVLMRKRAERKWKWVRPHISRETDVLDLGAGEGYVGACAAQDGDVQVVLTDVVDFNRTDLPHVVYDGVTLPFPDRSFDAVFLIFVLHHAHDAEQLLSEARRVTKTRVIVVESVYDSGAERLWLELADRVANRVRSSGRMAAQEDHLHFRRAASWRSLFLQSRFSIEHEDRRGNALHRQHLFVLDKKE